MLRPHGWIIDQAGEGARVTVEIDQHRAAAIIAARRNVAEILQRRDKRRAMRKGYMAAAVMR